MKPLTIEQLKALEVGDWVWCVDTKTGASSYVQKDSKIKDYFCIVTLNLCYYNYGTKWLAYKNKEQAEAKGEIVELPCKIGDEAWFVVTKGKLSKIIETYVTKFQVTNDVIEVHFDKTVRVIRFHSNGTRENVYDIYLDKSEAERRLAELTKE